MIRESLVIILVVLTLISCSNNQISELTPQELVQSVNKSFETLNFTNLTSLRNLSKKSEEYDSSKFDELVGDLLVERILPTERYDREQPNELSFQNQQLELFLQGYLVFNDEAVEYISDVISNQYLEVLSSTQTDLERILFIQKTSKFESFLNDEFLAKSEEVVNEIYTEITVNVDSRNYNKYSDRTNVEYILELLGDYKLAAKYEKFVQVSHHLNGEGLGSRDLDGIISDFEQAYGIPGLDSEKDAAKMSKAISLYNQLEGVWRGSVRHVSGKTNYIFLKIEDYHSFRETSFNINELPEFDVFDDDIYVRDDELYDSFDEKYSDKYELINGKLHLGSYVYERIR